MLLSIKSLRLAYWLRYFFIDEDLVGFDEIWLLLQLSRMLFIAGFIASFYYIRSQVFFSFSYFFIF